MTTNINKKQTTKFPLLAVFITAVTTALVMAFLFYFMGFHPSHSVSSSGQPQMQGVGKNGEPGTDSDATSQSSAQLWTCGMHPWVITEEPGLCPICSMDLIPKRAESTDNSGKGDGERKIVYWKAPMDPTEIYEQPGKSKMGMDLVPVYEDQLVGGVDIAIDPVVQQNMGVRMEVVEEGPLTNTIRTYGHITYDETRTAQVSPKVNGWIETLHINFTGVRVERGEPLLEIYSPELLSAQEEYLSLYLSLKKNNPTGNTRGSISKTRYDAMSTHDQGFLESARRRLRYFDVAEAEIKAIELSGQARKTITIRSPFSGVVTFKNAIEGGYIKAGTNIYTITDLSRVWVEAHIYEYELDQVKVGQEAEMMLPYLPGKTYTGKVTFIYPYLQQKTRDVVIRLEFENPDMDLKPEMYGDVRVKTRVAERGLQIPSEAVIQSGERNVVFVSRGGGKFTPREITTAAPLDDGKIQVLTGLAPGEKVVTSGQFMLDSESKLQEAVKKMMELAAPSQTDATGKRNEKKGDGETSDEKAHDHSSGAGDHGGQDDFFGDMEEKAPSEEISPSADDFFKDME